MDQGREAVIGPHKSKDSVADALIRGMLAHKHSDDVIAVVAGAGLSKPVAKLTPLGMMRGKDLQPSLVRSAVVIEIQNEQEPTQTYLNGCLGCLLIFPSGRLSSGGCEYWDWHRDDEAPIHRSFSSDPGALP
ncbi:MAG: hypothetical protein WCK39_09230 [Methanomassiliicoccales archaeon]